MIHIFKAEVIGTGKGRIPGTWEAKLDGKVWKIFDENGKLIATLADSAGAKSREKMMVLSSYMIEQLWGYR
ncbi:hypothetical protein ACFLYR_02245 [Chloroflexota bacterium]